MIDRPLWAAEFGDLLSIKKGRERTACLCAQAGRPVPWGADPLRISRLDQLLFA